MLSWILLSPCPLVTHSTSRRNSNAQRHLRPPVSHPFVCFVQLVLSPSAVVSLRTRPWSPALEKDYYSNVHRRFHPALSYSEDHTLRVGWWAAVWDKVILIVPLNSCCCEWACVYAFREVQRPLQDIIVRKPELYRMIFFGCKWSPGELSGSVWISVTEGRTRLVRKEDLCVLWVCVFIASICLCGFWHVRSTVVKSKLLVFVKPATGG